MATDEDLGESVAFAHDLAVRDAGVVDQDVDVAGADADLPDASADGIAGTDVEPEHPHAVLAGVFVP
ncbi:MAG TPA: hypothetical protein VIR33_07560 [Thermopolyspora sp.]